MDNDVKEIEMGEKWGEKLSKIQITEAIQKDNNIG